MNVYELIAMLTLAKTKGHGDRLVVVASDTDGGHVSELDGFSLHMYADNKIGLERLTDEARELGYAEEDVMSGGRRALVLWPE